jgi:3-oxoadipate enol-lactonase
MLSLCTTQFGPINCCVWEISAPRDIIILNGNLATYRWWQLTFNSLNSNLTQQKTKSRLIIFDLPGCGGHPLKKPIPFLDLVQTFKKLILDLKFSSLPSLLGHSTGGLIAAHLNAEKELNFHHVALLNPVGAKGFTLDEQTSNRYSRMQTDSQYSDKVIGATIYNCDFESDFFKTVISPDTFESVKVVGSSIVQSMSGLDSTQIYINLRSPTTLLYGQHDPLISLKDMEKIKELSPRTQLEVLRDVGHCPNIENPNLMAEVIRRLLF